MRTPQAKFSVRDLAMHDPRPNTPTTWCPPNPLPSRLETARLVIRFYEESDAPALFAAVDQSRSSLLPWLPWAEKENTTVDAALASIRRFGEARHNHAAPENNAVFGFVMGIFDKDTGALVGGTGFNRIDFGTSDAETGYWVVAARRGQGIATESTAALLSAGFTPQQRGGWGFRRIRIFASAANTASCSVPRKLGLREECRFVQHRWVSGFGWTDTLGWAAVDGEWDTVNHRPRP